MNSFEINKIVGVFLMSVLIITVIGQVGNLLVEAEELEESVYTVAGTEEPAVTEEPAAAEEVAAEPVLEPIAPLLTAASVESGKKLARKCALCHTLKKGGLHKIGPNLWDIVGADKARWENFSYSAAVAGVGGSWGYEELNAWVAKPGAYIPGTKMTFNGLKEPEDRADLIAYLRTLSDSPRPLP